MERRILKRCSNLWCVHVILFHSSQSSVAPWNEGEMNSFGRFSFVEHLRQSTMLLIRLERCDDGWVEWVDTKKITQMASNLMSFFLPVVLKNAWKRAAIFRSSSSSCSSTWNYFSCPSGTFNLPKPAFARINHSHDHELENERSMMWTVAFPPHPAKNSLFKFPTQA